MNIKIKKLGELNLLLVEGRVEDTGLKEIADSLQELPSSEEKFILLDCADIRKLVFSSIGFSGFINHLLHLRSMRATVTLVGCDTMVQRLLKVLKVENLFLYASTMDEAYLSLQKGVKSSLASNPLA
ncbi:STAS domain-containing protein [Pontibacter akesuensis]|uniref:STAS domain-containing protein n=1 Tax=Pontibacter akesuensis TaxID=388950 RepID=A0A1I7GMA7_9BACT|nr:hypothetical protein [Pontibacter akesuensis]GHA56082.1 hypothetical protein GCM10007389_04540 [Pontibacter akesuensis]SFU49471.1 hypothetical protein SAMN04487941_1122 [Pontibacter akesuensis]